MSEMDEDDIEQQLRQAEAAAEKLRGTPGLVLECIEAWIELERCRKRLVEVGTNRAAIAAGATAPAEEAFDRANARLLAAFSALSEDERRQFSSALPWLKNPAGTKPQ